MGFEQAPGARGIVGSHGLFELIDEIVRTGRERLDVGLQLGPTGETILTRDDELRSTECEARRPDFVDGRCPEPRMIRQNAPERLRVSGLVALEQVFGLILELVEVRAVWQWRLPSRTLLPVMPVVRRAGQEFRPCACSARRGPRSHFASSTDLMSRRSPSPRRDSGPVEIGLSSVVYNSLQIAT